MRIPWTKVRLTLLSWFARFYLEVLVGSVLLVLGLGYWWFLRTGFTQVRTQGRYNLLSSQTQEQYLKGYLADLQRVDAQLDKFDQEKLRKFSAILPAESDLPGLFVALAAVARASGMSVASVQFDEAGVAANAPPVPPQPAGEARPAKGTASARPVSSVKITLATGQGDYRKLKLFLTNLEANLRLLDVETVNFGDADVGPYSITLRAYYLPR